MLFCRVVELPAADGSFAEKCSDTAFIIDNKRRSNVSVLDIVVKAHS